MVREPGLWIHITCVCILAPLNTINIGQFFKTVSGLNFLICKMGIIVLPTSLNYCENFMRQSILSAQYLNLSLLDSFET